MKLQKPDYLVFFLAGMVMVMECVNVFIQVQLSTTGIELYTLQEQVKEIKRQNALIQEQILQKRALTTIAQEAKKQGFVEVRDNDYLYLK